MNTLTPGWGFALLLVFVFLHVSSTSGQNEASRSSCPEGEGCFSMRGQARHYGAGYVAARFE